ncbi:hypothetical protein HOLleu_42473 [Holothuria leucospilota]|uniref:BRCT domain-containing protein n=1 Tax=Holothuria leucospilota TaxID=206669 RepID=A0A9Q1BBB7_HOLLE|nr:hypothetical protein HOLleu_42473 [Holothuria leucospilota]
MEDYNGKEVQAFDEELGRWEPAKIVEFFNDDGSYLVSFIGWGSDYNTVVQPHHLGVAVHPFQSEVAYASSRGRKRNQKEGVYLSLMRSLKRGDKVRFELNGQTEEGTVQEVDRFSRRLVVHVGSEDISVHASSLVVPTNGTRQSNQTKVKRQKLQKVPAATQESLTDNDLQESVEFYSAMASDGRLICCGDVVSITGRPDINFGVAKINNHSEGFQAEGRIIGDEEINVSAPVHRLSDVKHWKIYGDAREIGGQPSTFVGISTLNDEASLHGVKYHDPNEIFPIAIFNGKDSRDKLEENLGHPNSWLDEFIRIDQQDGHIFYLSGDEMFLEAILDGSNVLGPNTNTGWDIYYECHKSDKDKTVNNMRTQLQVPMNRQHEESILKSIPLSKTIFCLLHAVARSVEKLLMLEIELLPKKGNKETQAGKDGAAFVKDKIFILDTNINRRGVRQSNFRITFDKGGKPNPVKLNKNHATVILAPPPLDQENTYPHVLHNEQTLDPDQYIFGYEAGDVTKYKEHAELFYQLFKLSVYQIFNDDSTDGKAASQAFKTYRDKCTELVGIPEGTSPVDMVGIIQQRTTVNKRDEPLTGLFGRANIVLTGTVPTFEGKKLTQAMLTKLIQTNGGTVKQNIPSGITSKKYVVVANDKIDFAKKVPSQVSEALQLGHDIVKYSFIFDTLQRGSPVNISDYKIRLSDKHGLGACRPLSVEEKYFKRNKFISNFVKKRKKRYRQSRSKFIKYRNPAMFYVQEKLKKDNKGRVSFRERSLLVKYYFIEWKKLSVCDKASVAKRWRASMGKQSEDNAVKVPAYSKYI